MADIKELRVNDSIFGFKDAGARLRIDAIEDQLTRLPFEGNTVYVSEGYSGLQVVVPNGCDTSAYAIVFSNLYCGTMFNILRNGCEAWPQAPNMCVGWAGFADYACNASRAEYAGFADYGYRVCEAEYASAACTAYEAYCASYAGTANCACEAFCACYASAVNCACEAYCACYASEACGAQVLKCCGSEYYPEEVEICGNRYLAFRIW